MFSPQCFQVYINQYKREDDPTGIVNNVQNNIDSNKQVHTKRQ